MNKSLLSIPVLTLVSTKAAPVPTMFRVGQLSTSVSEKDVAIGIWNTKSDSLP